MFLDNGGSFIFSSACYFNSTNYYPLAMRVNGAIYVYGTLPNGIAITLSGSYFFIYTPLIASSVSGISGVSYVSGSGTVNVTNSISDAIGSSLNFQTNLVSCFHKRN